MIGRCSQFERKLFNNNNSFPHTPFRDNIFIRPLCQTQSKTLVISTNAEGTLRVGLQSNAMNMEWAIMSSWFIVESPERKVDWFRLSQLLAFKCWYNRSRINFSNILLNIGRSEIG